MTTYAAMVALALSIAPASASPIPSQTLNVGGASIQVDFGEGKFNLPTSTILTWVETCAKSVTAYYGRFPIARARVLILPVADKRGVRQGTTWGNLHGFPAFVRIRLGEHTTTADLAADWTLTHELIHTAFPDLPDDQHWLEEGLATYIEPIARAQNGQLPITQVWDGMMQGMPNGEPEQGDRGLDRTHTWGRTYWGGAMFCLMADIAIHRQTDNRQGLQDAVRAIVNAGGGIDKDWPLLRTLEIGDHATNTTVLTDLYRQWSTTPSQVDLTDLWSKLGVRSGPKGVTLDPTAPWAKIREAITTTRPISTFR